MLALRVHCISALSLPNSISSSLGTAHSNSGIAQSSRNWLPVKQGQTCFVCQNAPITDLNEVWTEAAVTASTGFNTRGQIQTGSQVYLQASAMQSSWL